VFRETLPRSRLVHVVAPAGAGKTTLVAQAVTDVDAPVGWLTLEHWDRSADRFLRDLVLAVAESIPAVRAVLEKGESEDPHELANSIGTVIGDRELVLVVDNAHLLDEWQSSAEVLASLMRSRSRGMTLVLVERFVPVIPGIGADVLAATSTIGDDVVQADITEAEAIMAARGFDVDPFLALESSGGWIAGLVLEPGRGSPATSGRLAAYLAADVRPRLDPDEDRFLVRCSVFDRVDRERAIALAGEAGPAMVDALRLAGVPGVWDERARELRMHPRIREVLGEELENAPTAERVAAWTSAAAAYEREGDNRLALDALIEAGDLDGARRLLPSVIMEVIGRLDVEEAERLLAAVPMDPEPPEVMYARLCLAVVVQAAAGALPVLAALERDRNAADVFAKLPAAGAIVVLMYAAIGRTAEAFSALEHIPAGRAYDTARLILANERDDPDAPVPGFAGDMLDALIARGLYWRGQIGELQRITSTTLAELSGVPDLADRSANSGGVLVSRLARIHRAVSARDLEAAQSVIAEFEAMPWTNIFIGLCEAEIGIRIERSGESAMRGLAHACELPEAQNVGYSQLIDMWRGAALLLLGDSDAAVIELTRAVETMRRGGRHLMLPTALVYLAEASWQLGDEDEADRLTKEAYSVALTNGDLGRLLLALADFPGVLSRALDLESEPDGTWHALGRAVVRSPSTTLPLGTATVHVREFGEPALVVDGLAVRPKIRKSLEVVSFLLSCRNATALRSEILAALWNGRDDESTRAYLRQAVKHLREALPEGTSISTDGEALSLVGAFTSETAEFETLCAAAAGTDGPARRALLFDALEIGRRGVFLQGSRDVTWADERRASIAAQLVEARLDAAATLLDENRLLDVLELLDEVLAQDRLVERAWRLRMQALALLGDHDGVLDAYRACRSALDELDLAPSRGTRELAERLRA
jgi:DNA-binding SARP family transcriptional activator